MSNALAKVGYLEGEVRRLTSELAKFKALVADRDTLLKMREDLADSIYREMPVQHKQLKLVDGLLALSEEQP